MGIKAFNRWLKRKNYFHHVDDFSKYKIDTLFIDGSELLLESIIKYGKKDMIPYFLLQINEIIKCMKPINTVFFSLDGPNPAAKFQSERNCTFFHGRNIINYFEYPNEEEFKRKLQQEQEHDEGISQALLDYFPQLIKEDSIQTKTILYSSRYAPGESEHKYFKYFREQKKSNQLMPNQNHFIISNDNDLIFLSLQFIDEKFFVLKYKKNDPNDFSIIDISEIRNGLLENVRKLVTKNFNDHRVINDIIGLSFILGNDFIPCFPDIEIDEDVQVFDQLLDAYCKMNIENEKSEYKYLINNDSFDVSVLKKIITIFFQIKNEQDQNKTIQNNNENRIRSFQNDIFYNYHLNKNKQLDRIHSMQNKKFHYNENYQQNRINSFNHEKYNYYHFNQNKKLDRIHSMRNERFHYNENIPENRINSLNDKFHYSPINSLSTSRFTNQISSSENDDFHYHCNDNEDIEAIDQKNMAQSVLRTFNFIWIYYSSGVPSWTYYYPYEISPPLKEAVELMTQEGKEFFYTLEDNEITEPLLKSLITYPATKTNGIPWEIYKLKIPPSYLAEKYFPLSPNAPMINLEDIKKNYKDALMHLPKEDQIYNRREKQFIVYSKNVP